MAFRSHLYYNENTHDSIDQKFQLSFGDTGPTGPIGYTGSTGSTGPTGYTGSTIVIPFLYAYNTGIQAANPAQNPTNVNWVSLNSLEFPIVGANFTNIEFLRTGDYLITPRLQFRHTNFLASTVSAVFYLRLLIDGVIIDQTTIRISIVSGGVIFHPISSSAIASVTAGQFMSVQFASSVTGGGSFIDGGGSGSQIVTASLTIVKL